ncbi:GMP synthase glutamine-hydrolyzing [Clavibacter michiganensis subsp. michiganensis]|uniref:Glutamine amidotransferase n=2 Tax=Clavibacter michiganensis TaxID=28447 RepID=A0A251XKA2_CLAMM|nr:GMP synthase glutamine-hydrolyzing [Clavibacter michiganensis subsp. michiganensis]OUE03922.1 GMP synthase, glutamine-hydrolyzing [Clavibacter michiganensis subsp. michiganensis]
MSVDNPTNQRPVLVVDFGAQYAQLIARRVREANVYSEIVPSTITAEEIRAKDPSGIVLSGGPSSVYEEGSPGLDEGILELGVPVLGICYGFQVMARALGGEVAHTGAREYGSTAVTLTPGSTLLDGQPDDQTVWMSHGDSVSKAPEGFEVLASSASTPVAAFASDERRLYGVQWHPEVKHSAHGQAVLENFLHRAAGIPGDWNSGNVIAEQVERIRAQVGDAKVICGLSGGVDSAVAAAIVHRAVGDQLTCVFVDHGLLRHDERRQVEEDYVAATGVRLVTVDAADQFLDGLTGVTDPEAKRKIIGREFIRSFEGAAEALVLEAKADGEPIRFLVQGTLYPDVVESGGGTGTANIKSHHNVGGLPEDLKFELVEPLRTLFKDEVRAIGRELGLPEVIVGRQPFPAPASGSASSARSPRAPRAAAQGRRHRARRAHRRRPRRRDLAVPGRAPRGRPLGRRAGRRPDLRPPHRAAPRLQRGRDDRRLDPPPVRRARAHLEPHHERGRRREPRRARRHVEAAGHHRVGVILPLALRR